MAFPHASEKLQWDDALCFKISGKIFAILGLDDLRLCFKCTPEIFTDLIEREDIRPAPYVGRYKWVMLDRLDAIAREELKNLIRQSYDMVAAKSGRKSGSLRTHRKVRKKIAKRVKSTPRRRKG